MTVPRDCLLKTQFDMLARYNAFANGRLYEAAGALSEADYRADHGAFFKSVECTLNHLLVADRIWMQRFTGAGEAPNRLNAILFDGFAPLRAARAAEDARIRVYVEALGEAELTRVISYRGVTSPNLVEQPLWEALTHFFNHQTHHRGQVHALLTRIAGSAPELDLLIYQRLAKAGAA
ncbi:MAG: DinB family protein [Methylocella sp.]